MALRATTGSIGVSVAVFILPMLRACLACATLQASRAIKIIKHRYDISNSLQLRKSRFSAGRSIEYDPRREVLRKMFEPMLDARRYEHRVAAGKFRTFAGDDEFARSGNHEIDFIARVRRLRIGADRRVDLHDERAVRERLDEALAVRPFFRAWAR